MTTGSQQVKENNLNIRSILFSVFFIIFGIRKYCRVVGNSMNPELSHGDLIIYSPLRVDADDIPIGSIIVFTHPQRKNILLIKRIVKKTNSKLEVRGDNELISIDSRSFGLIDKKQVLGIVSQVIPLSNIIS